MNANYNRLHYNVPHADSCGSIVLCISPLSSLMVDQSSKFTRSGLKAEFVGEAQLDQEATKRVLDGVVQLVFITPENIMNNARYRDMLQSEVYMKKLVALIVDEAHCVKTWGDQFRRAFAALGDLRSIIPTEVNVMALTATATIETFNIVSKRLSMKEPVLVALPPDRGNIFYTLEPKIDLERLSEDLCYGLCRKRTAYPKTVVFVRRYRDCSDLYIALTRKLGEDMTDPPGYPNLSEYRLFDMFSSVHTSEKKEQVISSFLGTGMKLRLIIATSAFGLGIDCSDIRQIFHWGLPSNMEEYVQETGRAGRDGLDAKATLFEGKGGQHSSERLKEYVSNATVCRRKLLFEGFLKYYDGSVRMSRSRCCDLCVLSCEKFD